VARKAEEVACIVYKFVNRPAAYDGRGSLFCTDEVDQEQH
jgi:hypothetical protein